MVRKKIAVSESTDKLINRRFDREAREEEEENFQEEALFAFANSSSSVRLSYPSIFRFGMA